MVANVRSVCKQARKRPYMWGRPRCRLASACDSSFGLWYFPPQPADPPSPPFSWEPADPGVDRSFDEASVMEGASWIQTSQRSAFA